MAQDETSSKKGIYKLALAAGYISALAAITFLVFGCIEIFNIGNLRFVRMGNAFQFALLFAIFGMLSRMYYKMFG